MQFFDEINQSINLQFYLSMALHLLKSASNFLRGEVSATNLLRGEEETGKKRKRNTSREDSCYCSPEPLEMDGVEWSAFEIELGKRVLREYSTGGGTFQNYNRRGRYWTRAMWEGVVARYNELRTEGPQVVREIDVNDFVNLGKAIQNYYCYDRATSGGYGFTDMEDVFSPCVPCQLRIPVFPTRFANRSTRTHQAPYSRSNYSSSNSTSTSGHRRSHTEAFAFNNIQNNHSGGGSTGQELNSLIFAKLREMKINGYITREQYCRLLGRQNDLLFGFWPNHILDDHTSLSERAYDLVVSIFNDGASTSGQH